MDREKNWELPDPFGKEDGSRIGSKEEWENQKQDKEVKNMVS